MVKWLSKASLAKEKPFASLGKNVQLSEMMDVRPGQRGAVLEFQVTGGFREEFLKRLEYETFAGRDMEPEVWQPIYSVEVSADLPKVLELYTLGPGGVVFEEVKEGGEVKFASLTESTKTVTQKHYAFGFQYTKDMVIYNRVFDMALLERQGGVAFNALRNHIHLNPILTYSYTSANQTAASSVGSTLLEKMMSTLEDAIETSKVAERRGPYILLIAGGDSMKVANMLQIRVQDGAGNPRAGAGQIQTVIEYDGWSGTRGKKTTTYAGVTTGKAYLISTQYKEQDFVSKIKQDLQMIQGNPDVSRFLMDENIWDTYFGMYSAPANAVEEITWPTS